MAKIPGLYLRGHIYWFNYQIAGKRSHLSLGTSELSKAVEKINEVRANPVKGKGETIAATIESYLAHKVANHQFTESTRRATKVSLNDLGTFCTRIPISGISTFHMQSWFKQLKTRASEATAQTHLNRAKGFFRWCKEQRLCAHNPCEGVYTGRLPKNGIKRFCTADERDKMISQAPTRSDLRFILYCGFYAGLRRGEISEARNDWFDLKAGLLHVRKTDTFTPKDREERSIPLAKPFLEFLSTFKIGKTFAIQPKVGHGASIYRYDFRRPFTDHAKACKLDWVTPHITRHTFASLLASAGVSIYKIAIWMGDEVKTVQRHYAKLIPGDSDIDALH